MKINKKIQTPPFLQKGGTIGITAPSFGCTTEPYITRFKEAVRHFESLGYKFKIGDTVYKDDGIGISTDPKIAAKELVDFYCDPQVDIIISAGGGELMCETLSHIDFERVKKAPAKWFMGYSDNTNFIFPLVTGYGVKAIYGNNISGFGKPWEEPELDSLELLEGKKSSFHGYEMFQAPDKGTEDEEEDPLSPYVLNEKKVLKVFYPGQGTPRGDCAPQGAETLLGEGATTQGAATGLAVAETPSRGEGTDLLGAGASVDAGGGAGCSGLQALEGGLESGDSCPDLTFSGCLVGGCLDILSNIAGTRFDFVDTFNAAHPKVIWVLEACDLNPMDIRRAVWHLKEAGWFKNVAGFVVGRPLAAWGQNIMGVDQYRAVTDLLGDLNVPIVMDADVGHISPTIPLVMGADTTVQVKKDNIFFTFDL